MTRSYYVSQATGSDNNPGTFSRPFLTLNAINNIELLPSDRVFLERGSCFREDFRPKGHGAHCGGIISIRGYGFGSNPVVKGSDTIAGWSQSSQNIFSAQVPFVGDVCKSDCFLLKVDSEEEVALTPESYYWNTSTLKLTVNCSGDIGDIENAVRTTPILYDRASYMFHSGIDSACTYANGASSLNAGFGLLVWKSNKILVSNSKATNTQKHAMGDSNSTNVYWKNVLADGCLGNTYGQNSATAFVSFTTEQADSEHVWRDAIATWKAADGSKNNNTFIAHGSGANRLYVNRMKGPGVISFNKQTDVVQNWRAYNIESERLFFVADNVYTRGVTLTSEDDARLRFTGNNNRVTDLEINGPSKFPQVFNSGDNNLLNGQPA